VNPLAEQAVDGLNAAYGRHPGARAVHARGFVCRGRFTAAPRAAELTRAAHMQGESVDVAVRFSIADGDPGVPDWTRNTRGLAVKFLLPDGSRTDIVAATARTFYVRTPEDFVKMIRARGAGPATRPFKLLAFVASHPESIRALAGLATLKPIPSYANARYNSLHAFRWLGADGRARPLRYSWVPDDGELTVGTREAKRRGRDYLRREMQERLGRGPARFALEVQLAEEGDPLDDCTAAWPAERESVAVGALEVTELADESDFGDPLVFDPMRLTDGIEASGDPILRFRPKAYTVSVERRTA
jgi:catalase